MKILESIRPEVQPLDPGWSAATLESILADPQSSEVRAKPRRRGLVVATTAVAGLIGVGGVAYAAGLVPQSVLDAFSALDEQSGEDFNVSGVKPIADFAVPDGTQFTVWRGTNAAGGSCEAIREDRAGKDLDSFGVGCFSGSSADRYERLSFGWVQVPEEDGQPQNPMYYVAYGEATSALASSVQIAGDGTNVTLVIDPVTGGFGGNLPEYVAMQDQLPDLTFTFRDAAGDVVETQSPWQ